MRRVPPQWPSALPPPSPSSLVTREEEEEEERQRQQWQQLRPQYAGLEAGPAVLWRGMEPLEALGLWGAAMINPLPPLGVAPEIRCAVLESCDSLDRLRLLLSAIETSVDHMREPSLGVVGTLWRALKFALSGEFLPALFYHTARPRLNACISTLILLAAVLVSLVGCGVTFTLSEALGKAAGDTLMAISPLPDGAAPGTDIGDNADAIATGPQAALRSNLQAWLPFFFREVFF
jgi:hypothetical protein